MEQEFKIAIQIEDCRWTSVFYGMRDKAELEAYDLMNELIAKYIHDNHITDPHEQDYIMNHATYDITFDELPYTMMYGVIEEDTGIIASFTEEADAQEFILDISAQWAWETIAFGDSYDTIGEEEWDWDRDYPHLLSEAGKAFTIITFPAFDVNEKGF